MKWKPLSKKYVLSVSYGDYTAPHGGGTDKTILSHQRIFNDKGVSYIHIYPITKIWKMKVFSSRIWGVCVDGDNKGFQTTEQIIEDIKKCANENTLLEGIIVHHLLGVTIEEIEQIISAFPTNIYYYLHDFYMICPYSGLIRNGNSYCGEDAPTINKCKDCACFNTSIFKRIDEIDRLLSLDVENLLFIAPSETPQRIWVKHHPEYIDKTLVIYHQKCVGSNGCEMKEITDDQPIHIGFVGSQKPLKGWNYWEEAVRGAVEQQCNYKFYQFGDCKDHYEYIEEVEVDFRKHLNAMTLALREKNIHIAVLWSVLPETYSFTYYESLAANCFILTNSLSGNIAVQVDKVKNGYVAKTPEELKTILLNEKELREAVNKYRNSASKGPEDLVDNDEFADLVITRAATLSAEKYKSKKFVGKDNILCGILYAMDSLLKFAKRFRRRDMT